MAFGFERCEGQINRSGPQLRHSLPDPDSHAREHSAGLFSLIRQEIVAAGGTLPFWRYMELALYAPGLGYYSAGAHKFGAAGDFVTAPELGGLFARCVADATAPVMRSVGAGAMFLELGGGSGAFAEHALLRLAQCDALPARYAILEPSADLRERQRERLFISLPTELFVRVAWLDGPPQQAWQGVLFANEVLDALPMSRFVMRDGEAFEECVALDHTRDEGCGFVRTHRPADMLLTSALAHVARGLDAAFVDGYRSEVLPQLPFWIDAVAGTMERGAMLFVDYGYPRREFYSPERKEGTLICHYRHHAHADPFLWPGLQDITASVDFTALAEAGTRIGFELAGYCSQAQFLIGNGLGDALEAAQALPDIERLRVMQEAKRLTLPGEMGERFHAMGFQRDVDFEAAFILGDMSGRL
jgi:SAM-dependent MidA family methyltransferase